MAKENIAFLVNLRKNTVPDSDMFGRYYPEAESKETLSTKGFAKHVSDHGGTLVSYELMQLVMAAIVKCLKEMMSQGQPVKLDGLGTFRPTVTSVKGGAATIEDALRMGINNIVEGVNFIFIPENAQGEEITSKKFKEQCSLQFAYLVETIYKVIGGKKKSYTLRTPLSAWDIAQSDDEGTGENGSSSTGSENGSENGSEQASDFALTISKSGTGTSTVKDANDQVIESGASLASGASVNIAIVPAEGKIPTATINGTSIQLTESEGTYTGSFEMPAQASTLAINSGTASGNDDDDLIQN